MSRKSLRKTPGPQRPRNTPEEIRSASTVPKETTIETIVMQHFAVNTFISKCQWQEPILPPEARCDRCAQTVEGGKNQSALLERKQTRNLEAREMFKNLEPMFHPLELSFKAVCQGRKASLWAHRCVARLFMGHLPAGSGPSRLITHDACPLHPAWKHCYYFCHLTCGEMEATRGEDKSCSITCITPLPKSLMTKDGKKLKAPP